MFEHFGKHDCNKIEHDKKMKQDHYYIVIGGNNPGIYETEQGNTFFQGRDEL